MNHETTNLVYGEPVVLDAREGYALWSRVYDSRPNPMTALEERYLEPLIPDLRGRTVVDAGCGSGRWLQKLAPGGPRRLIGIDCSPEMLARATARQTKAELLLASCHSLPFRDNAADLVLSSFVIGYLRRLGNFAFELRRVVAPGGLVLISDLHPDTALRNGWQRGFSCPQGKFAIDSRFFSIENVVQSFQVEGFRLVAQLEPEFALPEYEIFELSQKREMLRELAGQPAIIILAFEAGGATTCASARSGVEAGRRSPAKPESDRRSLLLRGSRLALSATETIAGDLATDGTHIAKPSWTAPETLEIDLTGYLLLPGLINAHDHLEFALFPRLGSRTYENFRQWAEEIYLPSEPPLRDHLSIPKATRLWWGGLRNLLAGVTTVCHHNPFLAEVFNDEFPVDVIRDFGWAHSLALDPNVAGRFSATSAQHPFVIHLAEGVDRASAKELQQLDALCGVGENTVVVHGVGFFAKDRALLRRRGAALVWCPSSNQFLFGTTLTPAQLSEVGRVALGTDSPLTSAGDLLDEIRIARQFGMEPAHLFDLVTSGGAGILRLREGEGSLYPGNVANLVAFRDWNHSPAETLASASFRDVGLVMRRGHVQLASDHLMPRLPEEVTAGLRPLLVENQVIWVRAPLGRMFRDSVAALGCDLRLGGKGIANVSVEFL